MVMETEPPSGVSRRQIELTDLLPERRLDSSMGDTIRVLLVDDDPLLARGFARAFASRGIDLSIEGSLCSARSRLLAEQFDLVLLDLVLGDSDGLTLLQEWSGETSLPPTIVLSGNVDVRQTVRCMRAGAVSVVQKPATMDRLLEEYNRVKGVAAGPRCCGAAGAQPILGLHDSVHGVRSAVQRLSRFPQTNVLLCGDTGTGKSNVALALHELTDATKPFVALNCAAIPEGLFESELFGCEAGAYTGARKRRVGLLEQAGEGTLFLDEVGEMSPSVQPKLLRALETREFCRVGGSRPFKLRARVVAATHRPQLAESARFRADLYYRLAGFSIRLLPLAERGQDVEVLANHFLGVFCARHPGAPTRLSKAALDTLRGHSWPGNLRELKSLIIRSAIANSGAPEISAEVVGRNLRVEHLSSSPAEVLRRTAPNPRPPSFKELERVTITEAFRASQGNVSEAARRIGLPRSTVRDKLRKYGVA